VLMFAVSAIVSNRVLARLEDSQEQNLQQLASAYLDGLSASLIPSVSRADVWEVFDTLDRSRERYKGLNVRWTIVTNAEGKILAASDPAKYPSDTVADQTTLAHFSGGKEVTLDAGNATAFLMRPLSYQDREIGKIYAEAHIGTLLQERRDVFRTLLITNLLLTLLLATVGYLAIRRMIRPVRIMSFHLDQASQGKIELIPGSVVTRQSSEFRRLFSRYNILSQAVSEREFLAVQLAEEEKVASLGRLASGMAHEINNPLGGMFNALDALKKHGTREQVRMTSIRLLEQGLTGIRDLVRSTLASYRADQRPRDLTMVDLDDLRLLVKPEAKRKRLKLEWKNEITEAVHVPAVPVRDAVLNLLLNACASSAEDGSVKFHARIESGALIVDVTDKGSGLPAHIREYLERDGAGSVPLDKRSGLGLWIVKRLCDEMNGKLIVVKSSAMGTTIRLVVQPKLAELEDAA
ncbi:MAG: HAMP domain-containing sensor histidine kinase, partial [Aestuariivirga sp.]|nr:HAMP domain-containing sensor histidine kinase [Aestuariivirga sp.]